MNTHNIRVFLTQDILCPSELGQPLCSATSEGLFWVAFSNVIKGYATQTTHKEFQSLYEFQPIWSEVDAIHYLPDVKRVITVERRVIPSVSAMSNHQVRNLSSMDPSTALKSFSSSSNNNQNNSSSFVNIQPPTIEQCCRIYRLDYDKKERKTIIYPFTLPIQNIISSTSSSTSGINNVQNTNNLLISVCTYSNQLLTCARDVISLWKFTNNENPICILKLHTSWNVKCISVFNQFIGYGTTRDVRVIELKQRETDNDVVLSSSVDDEILNEDGLESSNNANSTQNTSPDEKKCSGKKSALLDVQKKIHSDIQDKLLGTTSAETPISTSSSAILTRHRSNGPIAKTMAMYWGVSQLESSGNDEIQIRLDMTTKELLPSPATQSYTEPVKISTPEKPKKGSQSSASNIAYDIFGETPTVDHPAFVNNHYMYVLLILELFIFNKFTNYILVMFALIFYTNILQLMKALDRFTFYKIFHRKEILIKIQV